MRNIPQMIPVYIKTTNHPGIVTSSMIMIILILMIIIMLIIIKKKKKKLLSQQRYRHNRSCEALDSLGTI